MTREEAKSCIGTIELLRRLAYNIHGVMDVIDADNCEKIIKSLEQEPCSNAIDRDEAIRVASGYCHPANVVKELAKLPPVTPEPKMGHWIFVDKAHEHAHCSECDYGDVDLFDGRPHNYCPSCGMKMSELLTD